MENKKCLSCLMMKLMCKVSYLYINWLQIEINDNGLTITFSRCDLSFNCTNPKTSKQQFFSLLYIL